MFSLFESAMPPSERDLVREECNGRDFFRERVFGFRKDTCLSTIPAAVIPIKVVAALNPNRHHDRNTPEAVTAMMTQVSAGSWPIVMTVIIISTYCNLHQRNVHGSSIDTRC
jgi:hypothetical protein